MDVEHAARPAFHDPGREDAHVPREHDDIRSVRFEQLADRALLFVTRVIGNGKYVEAEAEPGHQLHVGVVVRRNEYDFAWQLTQREPNEQIAQAVALARRKDRHPRTIG